MAQPLLEEDARPDDRFPGAQPLAARRTGKRSPLRRKPDSAHSRSAQAGRVTAPVRGRDQRGCDCSGGPRRPGSVHSRLRNRTTSDLFSRARDRFLLLRHSERQTARTSRKRFGSPADRRILIAVRKRGQRRDTTYAFMVFGEGIEIPAGVAPDLGALLDHLADEGPPGARQLDRGIFGGASSPGVLTKRSIAPRGPPRSITLERGAANRSIVDEPRQSQGGGRFQAA